MQKFQLTLLFIMMTPLLWGQTQQQKLEQRKAQILKEIKINEDLLKSVNTKEKSITNQIIIQDNKIKLKEQLIQTTERQTKLLNDDIYRNQLQINLLQRELAELKEDYSEMIRKSYKSRSEQSRAMFLLSSENFLQAYKRAQYMKQYANYRRNQGVEIGQKTEKLTTRVKEISVQKDEKEKLRKENEKDRIALLEEKKEHTKLFNDLKKDKKNITVQIKKKQTESRAIDRQIDKLIREAIAEANRKAAAANAKANPKTSAAKTNATATSSKIVLTPEGKVIADNFRANKGRLPWPVERGVVTLRFGDQPHPVHRSLVVHNSGVEITTEDDSNARAVFDGEVSSVIVLSPVNKAVMIQHGDYFTVYQNLSNVYVNKGDKVSIKQNIGKIRRNGDTGKTIIKFTISQNTTYTNPSGWLSGM